MNPETNRLTIKSYPGRLVSKIPLSYWMSLLLLWEIFFLADYIYSLNIPGGHDHVGAFAALTLFFASLTISTVYCCNVLVDLFPDFGLFVDHDQGEVRNWYERKLKWCYQGPWPLIAGLVFAFLEYFTIGDLLKSFTPDHPGLQGLRTGFQTAGFFFWA